MAYLMADSESATTLRRGEEGWLKQGEVGVSCGR